MRQRVRPLASLCVGLVVLLLLEVPALAYPGHPVADVPDAPPAAGPVLASSLLDHGIPSVHPLHLRRAQQASGSGAPATSARGKWVPTMPEGAVFTVIGAGLLCGGGVLLGVGLGRFLPIVLEASGLVTTAVGPLVLVGLGLTLMVTGIPLLIHGVKVLQAVRDAEDAAATARAEPWQLAWQAPPAPMSGSLTIRF
jgi:hypothetical protein